MYQIITELLFIKSISYKLLNQHIIKKYIN
jgi:hypothetical protein